MLWFCCGCGSTFLLDWYDSFPHSLYTCFTTTGIVLIDYQRDCFSGASWVILWYMGWIGQYSITTKRIKARTGARFNSNSMDILLCCNTVTIHPIGTILCTCHDSRAVVACVRFYRDHCIRIVKAKRNSYRIWIVMEKPLVKRTHVCKLREMYCMHHECYGINIDSGGGLFKAMLRPKVMFGPTLTCYQPSQ